MTGRLGEMGERRIVSEILAPRYGRNSLPFGDDCAQLPIGSDCQDWLLVTTDPCPPPMAHLVGFKDEYYRGWLLATINLSDLAAAGAEPLGLLTSLQLPAEMKVADFVRLLDGVDECAAASGTSVIGGNLKESPKVDVSATAIGRCDDPPLTRRGAASGDLVVMIGELGEFWAGTLGLRSAILEPSPDEPLLRNVLTPRARISAAADLRRQGLLSTCIDNSDGLYPSLIQLADANDTAIRIDRSMFSFSERVLSVAAKLDLDPFRLALGWGDWQLLGTCGPSKVDGVLAVTSASGEELRVIGEVVPGAGVRLREGGDEGPLLPLDSQRFMPDSWFTAGIEAYIEAMRHGPLRGNG